MKIDGAPRKREDTLELAVWQATSRKTREVAHSQLFSVTDKTRPRYTSSLKGPRPGEIGMEREYDLFERFPDAEPMWRGHAVGLLSARQKLQALTRATRNECFIMHLPTKEVVARLNVRSSRGVGRKPVVFQIAYESSLATARTMVLRLQGYEVVSVVGNEAAKVVLSMPEQCDFFILGHAADDQVRREMVSWLKAHYPGVRILALNPPKGSELVGADYNVKLNGPEIWLPIIATALRGPQESGP